VALALLDTVYCSKRLTSEYLSSYKFGDMARTSLPGSRKLP
jgi:hypothetical protein